MNNAIICCFLSCCQLKGSVAWRKRIILFLSAILLPAMTSAETDDEEDVYELSPFLVETTDDRGYISTNTTAGTSLNTALRNLPMGIEIINREFLEDVQATDMREALSYTPGVFMQQFENRSTAVNPSVSRDYSPSSMVGASEFNDAIVIRGYTVPNQQRMGFRMGTIVPAYGVALGGITDSANTQRQEVVRGPQSLLYGINVLSGIVNIMPRRPLPDFRTDISMGVGNMGFRRMVLDNTGPLIDGKLNYRVLAAFQNEGDPVDFREREREYYVGQLEWRIHRRAILFAEVQYMDSKAKGIGPQFFVDNRMGGNRTFKNTYGESYQFGWDYYNEHFFDHDRNIVAATVQPETLPDLIGLERDGQAHVIPGGTNYFFPKPGRTYEFPDLGRNYNISGPDTYRSRREFNFTAVLNYSPFQNLDMETGVFYADVKDTEFNIHRGVFNNSLQIVIPTIYSVSQHNPEIDINDPYGFGPGELFIMPRNAVIDRPEDVVLGRKYGYYYWYERPTTAETWQFRQRAAYTFETSWLNGRIDGRHTFSGGLQYIQDEVSFVLADFGNLRPIYTTNPDDPADNRLDRDPFIFRDSIFDYEPIRYDPALGSLAMIGRTSFAGLGDVNHEEDYITRSGWKEATLWYRGKYGVYHGRFFDDRLHIVLGVRQDRYQVREKELLRVLDQDRETDFWQGGSSQIVPVDAFAGFGDVPYEWNPDLPDSLNEKVAMSVDRLRLTHPQGTIEKNFAEDESYNSKTMGFNYSIHPDLSVYYLYSEGIFPNSGLRDGAYQTIKAERTTNNEVGLKFDFLDGRISGRIAYWEIDRRNAVWNWQFAPNPQSWWGGPNVPAHQLVEREARFSPRLVDNHRAGVESDSWDIRYGVPEEYVLLAFEKMGMDPPLRVIRPGQPPTVDTTALTPYGFHNFLTEVWSNPLLAGGGRLRFYMVNYHDMLAVDEELPEGNPLKLALDMAVRDSEFLDLGGLPILYQGDANPADVRAHSASGPHGANVLFEEKGRGIDGQIFFTPRPNYQIIFGFSQQERDVRSFTMVSGHAVDSDGNVLTDGPRYTTEYDIWVFMLGPDNFEDPRDPSSLKSGAIHGLDLSFVPRTHLNLWNKYTFTEGLLERLEVGGGINYYSRVATSTPVSSREMGTNPFRTPDIPSRYQVDAYLGYRFDWDRTRWRIAFNVYNLLNNQVGEAFASYDSEEGIRNRRTRQFYNPRSYRLSVSVQF